MILHGMVKTVPVVTTVTLYIRDQPIMLLCLPIMLCYSALKFTNYPQYYAQEQELQADCYVICAQGYRNN